MASENVVSNKQVICREEITGLPKESDMHITTITISLEVPQGLEAVLVKNLYLSCDPYMRGVKDKKQDRLFYSFSIDSPVVGYGVAKVIDSGSPDFKVGELVWVPTKWEEYSLLTNLDTLVRIQHTDVPLSYYTGLLGMPGHTTYIGFYEICAPKKGDRVFISSTYGDIDQIVGQMAKLMGCYVVGSAGSKEKVDLLKGKLGFDDAFNYKEEHDLDATLKRRGKMLDPVLLNIRLQGRIAASGMISQYDLAQPDGITNLMQMVYKRIKMQGFSSF
ncbi:alcohol dehydrogenase, putative [Ricinus communis]|uniref:Alcohol dehydrogenase, putative n=1 Tax=Ricinus communis TaxID=3988 RepID=B9SUZ7_RICCO|nr:alcohol dehydrogenase, putative [Ricinus communis]